MGHKISYQHSVPPSCIHMIQISCMYLLNNMAYTILTMKPMLVFLSLYITAILVLLNTYIIFEIAKLGYGLNTKIKITKTLRITFQIRQNYSASQ